MDTQKQAEAPALKDNYILKIERLAASGALAPVRAQEIKVYHDAWCAIYRGGRCNCDPDVIPGESFRA